MPKRPDIKSVIIIGSGPIIIGQACEFDYAGAQACKSLKEEGIRVILVNSNPATIMTDPELADATYIEPITPEVIEDIIAKERPDALLPTMGGQVALNCSLSLHKSGILDRYNVQMIGATVESIDKAEDRDLFRQAMLRIGLETPNGNFANASSLKSMDRAMYIAKIAAIDAMNIDSASKEALKQEFITAWRADAETRKRNYVSKALIEALEVVEEIGLPAIIRPSFTMGGTGGGVAYNREEFIGVVERGLVASPTTEVLIEASVLGWKEYELEVVCDQNGNCIIVCSIENLDPMGVHTGDSITVAPALTLTDKEYQRMRCAAKAVIHEIGVNASGANVQFAINPLDGQMVVVEMNPRVSRSSALASKATGFPIAKIAAKLAIGYTLDELRNDITGGSMPAAFEPSIDYVVTKIPRFAFEKFPAADQALTTSMKSVGEVMAIGRTFPESLQKALRGLETGLTGLNEIVIPGIIPDSSVAPVLGSSENLQSGFHISSGIDESALRSAIATPTPNRLLYVAEAMRMGCSLDFIYEYSKIDRWFLGQILSIIHAEEAVRARGIPQTAHGLCALKGMGFSDARLAELAQVSESEVLQLRNKLDIHPVYKRVDTCAAEFTSCTAYMYSTYELPFEGMRAACEAAPSNRKKILIIGGGPNRIGQGIEFDYCCCHAAFVLRKNGYETIMVNCNPETVSTDYDTSDRLYFEPLTAEDLLEIIRIEQKSGEFCGVLVQFGGQTPLRLAKALHDNDVPILGTSIESIHRSEDREQFKKLLHDIGLIQPENRTAYSIAEGAAASIELGFPLVVRPSHVIGGRAMKVIRNKKELDRYFGDIILKDSTPSTSDATIIKDSILKSSPLLLDRYLSDAIEVDVDAIADGHDVCVVGIMEHVEEAGIHSGDSACAIPPYSLSPEIVTKITEQTRLLAHGISVIGLVNVQFAIKDDQIYVLELNPRASRTVPFVAKATGIPLAQLAARVMTGARLRDLPLCPGNLNYFAVKESVFPFARFLGVDTVLGPEMLSTGEAMGIDTSFALAFAKAQLGANTTLPHSGVLLVSISDKDKPGIVESVRSLIQVGFRAIATRGTWEFLHANGIVTTKVNKVIEGRPHVVDAIKNGEVQLMFNITDESDQSLIDSQSLRNAALLHCVPYCTTLRGAVAVSQAIVANISNGRVQRLGVNSLQFRFNKL